MAAAVEAINGLTDATETANVIAKSAGGVMDVIMKSLSSIVDLFIRPIAPALILVLAGLVLALIGFKLIWDALGKWFEENITKPIENWVKKYILDPLEEAKTIIIDFFSFKWVGVLIDKIKESDAYKWLQGFISMKWMWDIVDKVKESETYKWIQGFVSFKWLWEIVDKIKESGTYKWLLGFVSFQWLWDIADKIKENESYKWLVGFSSFKWFWDGIDKIKESEAYKFLSSLPSTIGKVIHNIVAWAVNAALQTPVIGRLLASAGLQAMAIQSFEQGGVVPGSGAQLAIVHGGETITPAGKGGNTFNFYGYQDDKFIQKVKDVLRTQGTVYNL